MSEYKGISLLDAAQSWDIDTLKRVVEAGACINDHDEEGKSALYYSSVGNRLEHVKFLLEKGANANEQNINSIGYATSPLIEVSRQGHTEVASCLVEAGADMNYAGYNKCTPLWWAVLEKHPETALLLICKGANVNVVDTDNNTTPLLLACKNGLYELAVKLLEHGADPDIAAKQLEGTTFSTLHASIGYCHTKIVKLLLKHKVKIQLDGDGETPLEYARNRLMDFESDSDNKEQMEGYSKIISMLERYDAKQKKKDSKNKRHVTELSEEEAHISGTKSNDEEVSDKYLLRLAKDMAGDWKMIGGFLGLKHSQIQELIAEHKTDPLYAAWSMLVAWRDGTEWRGDSMRQHLRAALLDAERSDIAHKL